MIVLEAVVVLLSACVVFTSGYLIALRKMHKEMVRMYDDVKKVTRRDK